MSRPRDPTPVIAAKLAAFAGLIGLGVAIWVATGRIEDPYTRDLSRAVLVTSGVTLLIVGSIAWWWGRRSGPVVEADPTADLAQLLVKRRRAAMRTLRRVASPWWFMRPPHRWTLLVGPSGAGKTGLLVHAGQAARVLDAGGAQARESDTSFVRWVLCADQLVLDVGGKVFEGTETANHAWAAVMSAAAHHRSCPGFDQIVVCLSLEELSRATSHELEMLAARYAARLSAVPARSDRPELHLVLTHLDAVHGFVETFARAGEEVLARPFGRHLQGPANADSARASVSRVFGELWGASSAALPHTLPRTGAPAVASAALMFPDELRALESKVSSIVASWGQSGIRLYGMWFTGRLGAPAHAGATVESLDQRLGLRHSSQHAAVAELPRPAFLRELVPERITASSREYAGPPTRAYVRAFFIGAVVLALILLQLARERRALAELTAAVDGLQGQALESAPSLAALSARVDASDLALFAAEDSTPPRWTAPWVSPSMLALRDAWMAEVVHPHLLDLTARRAEELSERARAIDNKSVGADNADLEVLVASERLYTACTGWPAAATQGAGLAESTWAETDALCSFADLATFGGAFLESTTSAPNPGAGLAYAAWLHEDRASLPEAPRCAVLSSVFAEFPVAERELVKAIISSRGTRRSPALAADVAGRSWHWSTPDATSWNADGFGISACEHIQRNHILGDDNQCGGAEASAALEREYARYHQDLWTRWWRGLQVMERRERFAEGELDRLAPVEVEFRSILHPGADLERFLRRQGVGNGESPRTCGPAEGEEPTLDDRACCACACLRRPWSLAEAFTTEGTPARAAFVDLQTAATAVADQIELARQGRAAKLVADTAQGAGPLHELAKAIRRIESLPPQEPPSVGTCDCDTASRASDVKLRVSEVAGNLLSRATAEIFESYADAINRQWSKTVLPEWRALNSRFPLALGATSEISADELVDYLGCDGTLTEHLALVDSIPRIDTPLRHDAPTLGPTEGARTLSAALADICRVVDGLNSPVQIRLEPKLGGSKGPAGVGAFYYEVPDRDPVRADNSQTRPLVELSASTPLTIRAWFGSGRTGTLVYEAPTSAWPVLRLLGEPALRAGGSEISLGHPWVRGKDAAGRQVAYFSYAEPARTGPRSQLRELTRFSLPDRIVAVVD